MGGHRDVVALYSDSATIGGAERSLLHLASVYAGARELVICSPADELLAEAERMAPHVRRHQMPVGGSFGRDVAIHRRELRRLGVDLLQVTLCNPFTARAAQAAGFVARIPTVAVEQLALPSRRWQGAVVKSLWSRPLAGHVAVGCASADDVHRWFRLPRSSITVIHNGVPERTVVPERLGDGPVIGCAARLEEQKNLHVLVAALADVPGVTLALIGDGALRDELTDLARERGVLERVRFLGWIEDPRPQIAGLDLFVLPSRAESFPLSIVEAMLSGVPVIASDVGSVSDAVVHGHTGLLVREGDPVALATAVRRLLGDDRERATLAAAAQARATEHFTDVVMAARYDELWTRALCGRRRRAA